MSAVGNERKIVMESPKSAFRQKSDVSAGRSNFLCSLYERLRLTGESYFASELHQTV